MSGFDEGRPSRLVVAAAVLDRLERPTALLCAPRHADYHHDVVLLMASHALGAALLTDHTLTR